MKFFSSYTAKIILANLVVFLAMLIFVQIFGIEKTFSLFALQPTSFFSGNNIWTLLTSIFAHANFTHLFVNMFSLFFVGSFVEKIIGKRRFLIFYLAAGIFAGLFFASLSFLFGNGIGERIFGNPQIYGVGASGAIFGLLGLLAVLTPKNRVYLLAGPIVAIILQILAQEIFPIPALGAVLNILVTIYIVLSIIFIFSFNPKTRKLALPVELPFWLLPFLAIAPLIIIGIFIPLPIGNMAHLGGLLAGLAYGYYLVKKYPRRAALLSRMFSK
jgi:membrane associated rhomboid family serine protease